MGKVMRGWGDAAWNQLMGLGRTAECVLVPACFLVVMLCVVLGKRLTKGMTSNQRNSRERKIHNRSQQREETLAISRRIRIRFVQFQTLW
jgi:hypothetical protein